MKNKRGGFGAKFLLVLILMIASAIGGAYGYRVLDGKMAVKDAQKAVDSVKISEYDTEEAVKIEGLKEETAKDLETAATRKEVYEIMDSFKEEVDKVMTKTEKELEEARKAVSEAQKSSQQSTQTDTESEISNNEGTEKSGNILSNLFGNNSSNNTSDSTDTADEYDNEDTGL